jgi:hypothetical protein
MELSRPSLSSTSTTGSPVFTVTRYHSMISTRSDSFWIASDKFMNIKIILAFGLLLTVIPTDTITTFFKIAGEEPTIMILLIKEKKSYRVG